MRLTSVAIESQNVPIFKPTGQNVFFAVLRLTVDPLKPSFVLTQSAA